MFSWCRVAAGKNGGPSQQQGETQSVPPLTMGEYVLERQLGMWEKNITSWEKTRT